MLQQYWECRNLSKSVFLFSSNKYPGVELLDLIAFLIFWETSTCFPWRLLFSHSVMSNTLWLHGLQHVRLPCLSLYPGVCSNLCPLSYYTIQSFHPLLPPSPPAINLSQYQVLFQWVSSSRQVAKELELQLQHQSFQWIFTVNFF